MHICINVFCIFLTFLNDLNRFSRYNDLIKSIINTKLLEGRQAFNNSNSFAYYIVKLMFYLIKREETGVNCSRSLEVFLFFVCF